MSFVNLTWHVAVKQILLRPAALPFFVCRAQVDAAIQHAAVHLGVWKKVLVSDMIKTHQAESLHTLTKWIRSRARAMPVSKTHHRSITHFEQINPVGADRPWKSARRITRTVRSSAITWLYLHAHESAHSASATYQSKPPKCVPHQALNLSWHANRFTGVPLGIKGQMLAIRFHLCSSQREKISGHGFYMCSIHCHLPQHVPFICFLRLWQNSLVHFAATTLQHPVHDRCRPGCTQLHLKRFRTSGEKTIKRSLHSHCRGGTVVLLQSFLIREFHSIQFHQDANEIGINFPHRDHAKLGFHRGTSQGCHRTAIVETTMQGQLRSRQSDLKQRSQLQARTHVTAFQLQVLLIFILLESEARLLRTSMRVLQVLHLPRKMTLTCSKCCTCHAKLAGVHSTQLLPDSLRPLWRCSKRYTTPAT